MQPLPNYDDPKNNQAKKRIYDRSIIEIYNRMASLNPNSDELLFSKDELEEAISDLGLSVDNIPDIPYSYRVGRTDMPEEISTTGNWVIQGAGKGKYKFIRLARDPYIAIPDNLYITEIPEATPDIVLKYGGADEQAVLTRIEYNRLVDIFLSLTAFHLQGHVRSSVAEMGQVEVDDLYVGVNTEGEWFVIPIEAKSSGMKERLGVIQVQQMILFAKEHYSELILRPIGIKTLEDGSFVFVEFDDVAELEDISVKRYSRYMLVRDDK